MASISTGMLLGSEAMPTALRAALPFLSPKTCTINSLKSLITCGCFVKSRVQFTTPIRGDSYSGRRELSQLAAAIPRKTTPRPLPQQEGL